MSKQTPEPLDPAEIDFRQFTGRPPADKPEIYVPDESGV